MRYLCRVLPASEHRANLDSDGRDYLTVWLVGHPLLARRLRLQQHAALAQRIVWYAPWSPRPIRSSSAPCSTTAPTTSLEIHGRQGRLALEQWPDVAHWHLPAVSSVAVYPANDEPRREAT